MKENICHICKIPLNKEGSSICSAVHSPQPEEWSVRFEENFASRLTLGGEGKSTNYLDVEDFIRDEIRKAEKRKVDEILNTLLKEARKTDYADRTEYDVAYDFIKSLEALKK